MHEPRDITRVSDTGATPACDDVAVEAPLEIRVRGRPVAITMRTPGHDAELALGFLISEGIIHSAADVLAVEPCLRDDSALVNVTLAADVAVDFERLTRHVFSSSSCGVCGKATIESITQSIPRINSRITVAAKTISSLIDKMRAAQTAFARTGGLHAAAVFTPAAELLCLREDVGRHNAVDKVVGWSLEHQWPLADQILLVSGRLSFEIVQKAAMAGLPVLAAISAPSTLAVDLAQSAGITLAGFVRDGRFNVYTHAQRIDPA